MLRSLVLQQGRAGLDSPFPPAAPGTPGLGRVRSWCHLVALGHGKGRGSFMFIICVIIMGVTGKYTYVTYQLCGL